MDLGMSGHTYLEYVFPDFYIHYADKPLAEGVNVLDGHVNVTVPQVAAGKNYQILGELLVQKPKITTN